MPVAIIMDFPGATLEQYDQVMERMGLSAGGEMPPHAIAHWVAETDDGIRVVDLWENLEAFQQFAEEQIGPYSAEVGIANPPKMTFYDVHSFIRSH